MTHNDWAAEAASLLFSDRGFTVHPQRGAYGGAGYGVSPYPGRELRLPAGTTESQVGEALRLFFEVNRDVLTRPQHFIGGWLSNFQPSPVYLDVAVVTMDEAEAQDLQARFAQRAIHTFEGDA